MIMDPKTKDFYREGAEQEFVKPFRCRTKEEFGVSCFYPGLVHAQCAYCAAKYHKED